jgi:hypothetical protein
MLQVFHEVQAVPMWRASVVGRTRASIRRHAAGCKRAAAGRAVRDEQHLRCVSVCGGNQRKRMGDNHPTLDLPQRQGRCSVAICCQSIFGR